MTVSPHARAAAIAALVVSLIVPGALSAEQLGPSGLPLPRFASTKAAPVNVRQGPTREHEVAWTFVKAGVPVEITQEYDIWLRIRDSEGQEGWVQKTLLSGKRTALVTPWEKKGRTPLREKSEAGARIVAEIEGGVLVEISECTGRWCRASVEGVKGWIEQGRLWGAYPEEVFRS
ncbi:aspartyl-trna synthetase [Siculibacillus lacustris]|uniref:Aspartyl-trna synthetase n=1 Tax=Siculibacillus lacustris TaxID=1549641 RepID=A0A4V2KTB5_9HYPH|nr:SH3 domain-containing protein [Siculibacillus lacustris]TBW36456.1 aspartyl-trna synthetase [Siculibacillus lacustris]